MNNCPEGCINCLLDHTEEAEERRIEKLKREEDDVNFADQDEREGPNYNLAEE